MKKQKTIAVLALLITGAMNISPAQAKRTYPKIYPFVPMTKAEIYNDVAKVTEDKHFIKNFKQMAKLGLKKAKTKNQPWGASYWPLSKGGIADPYEGTKVEYYAEFARTHKGVWKETRDDFKERQSDELKRINSMSEEELAKLAPSEKYDLLLGDYSFDLTHKLMNYMTTYAEDNYFGNLSDIHVAMDDTVDQIQKYVQWGWAANEREALDNFVLSSRLEVKRAKELLASGAYTDVIEAVKAATPRAMAERNNYVIADEKVKHIAAWEGICNGWSTAAGVIPRPKKAISFKLPSGKNLKFYPEDIKGLVSLYWFNSFIQNNLQTNNDGSYKSGGTVLVGNRCNHKDVKKDRYGRRYDSKPDPYSGKIEPRCAGVHPAKWHLGLTNLVGVQKRSFIVERKVQAPVDNHPMSAYKSKYFNPSNGHYYSDLEKNIVEIDSDDQFEDYRHKDAKYIVGVRTTMTYLDYHKPFRSEKNDDGDDSEVDKRMLYDLELDSNYNIVGGQWRTVEMGKPLRHNGSRRSDDFGTRRQRKPNYNQPDFFWAVTKDWKKSGLFNDNDIQEWTDTKSAPPRSWLAKAKKMHDFKFYRSTYYGNGRQCDVRNTKTGEVSKVWCAYEDSKPQPLSNVINKLVELSSGVKFEDM